MNNALSETGLIDYYKIGSSFRSVVLQTGDELAEKNTIYTVLTLIMVLFAVASVVFASVNNVSNSMQSYAVHNLVGATQIRIIVYAVSEVFVYCILGFVTGFLWRFIFEYVELGSAEHPALPAAVLLLFYTAAAFTLLACVLSFVFVYVKVKGYSTSELIRGREIKTNRTQPFYKVT